MLSEIKKPNSVALELTEIGLSLFTCEGDVPTECIAYVDLDDPDFSQKSGGFRNAAEAHVGKGFQTDIWLPDEQVMLRSIKLEGSAKDQRAAAYSALSASTPFQGDALCFDLGDANGAGYTPVAAIPRDKMDEAMDFAKKMRMNPRSITTSNVVFGFDDRPDFKPYVPQARSKAGPARALALAAVLVAPVLLFTGERTSYQTESLDAGMAFVAAFENVPEPVSVSTRATHRIDEAPVVVTPDLVGEYAPLKPFSYEVTEYSVTVENVQSIAPENPMAIAASAPYGNELVISGRDFQFADETGVSADVELSSDRAGTSLPVAPQPLSAVEEDIKPAIFSDASDYVQNVLEGPIRIRDLVAVDEVSANDSAFDFDAVRVANVGGTVRRPNARVAPRLIQPSFAKRPERRPVGAIEPVSDEITAGVSSGEETIEVVIPKPVFGWYVDGGLMPQLGELNVAPILPRAPDALIFKPGRADEAAMTLAWRDRKNAAARRAANNERGDLARLRPPKTRDILKASPDGGIIQYTTSVAIKSWRSPPDHDGKSGLSPPRSTEKPAVVLPPNPLAAFVVAEILPLRMFSELPARIRAEVTREATQKAVPEETIARPKARKKPVALVETSDETDNVAREDVEVLEPVITARAADAIGALKLRRPPARKKSVTLPVAVVATPTDPSGPISDVAIARLLSPVERPAHLRKTAAKILAKRSSVTEQVAKKQEPVQTTNSNRLRIPSNARVGTTATIKDGINLGDISLIGIFGKSKSRRALVRLPQGRYVQVTQGDNVSGWTVSAVGKDAVRIVKRGKNVVLRLPN